MNIINISKISLIKNYFECKDTCIIFGKGPTFKIIKTEDISSNVAVICINDTINYIDNCDLLVCNDIESFKKINLKRLNNCSNILIPYHIHYNCKADINKAYKNVIKIIEPFFTGNLIVYNLSSINKNYKEFITLKTALTSSHTAFEFIGTFIKNIKSCIFYGVAKKCDNRDAIFYNNSNCVMNKIHQKRCKEYKDMLDKLSKSFNLSYTLN